MAYVAKTKNPNHPFALVDHRQSSNLQRLHVLYRLHQVIIFPAAMDA
jgi:hypothetical protein